MAAVGGARKGSGRKNKHMEEKVSSYAISAIVRIFGSEKLGFDSLAEQAKISFPHMKLLLAYAYGGPKEKVEHSGNAVINITVPTDEPD